MTMIGIHAAAHRICIFPVAFADRSAAAQVPMTETLYEGPANNATFYLPSGGIVRFAFSERNADGYVRSRTGALARVYSGSRVFLSAGHHVLFLYDPTLMVRVSITFLPD
jgi:hypothetical protein